MGGAHLSLLPMEGVHWPPVLPLGWRFRTLHHMHQVRCCHCSLQRLLLQPAAVALTVFRNCGVLRCHPQPEQVNDEHVFAFGALPLSPPLVALWPCLAACACSFTLSDSGPLPIREKGLGEEHVAFVAFSSGHLCLLSGR